ncbi:MAG: hypothetical protein QNK16_12615 [Woeseiaceae bacterium]|nr:hypothetical protein [Woeseiaceae bacterium]MDX2609218.1 hypothetical protein [Woeseiaceae bacterium]
MKITTLLLLVLAFASSAQAIGGEPDKVLFVGNSFTYYNNGLHKHYEAIVESANGLLDSRIMTISSGHLREHIAGLPSLAASDNWDVIVLQGYSKGPIGDDTAKKFRKAAKQLVRVIRRNDAKPVFFMTWAYIDEPEMTALLDDAYTSIGKKLDAQVVPVGLAFERAIEQRPDLKLRIADRKHPTLAGTYLAACTFYAALHQQNPGGLGYTAGLDPDDAAFLQRVAWDTAEEYSARNTF